MSSTADHVRRQAEHFETLGSPLYARLAERLAVEPDLLELSDGDRRFALQLFGVRFLAEQAVQTNEVQRCFALLPGFLTIARATGKPFDLLELGPSAGLNLLWDRYLYSYAAGTWGPPDARLSLGGGDPDSSYFLELAVLPELDRTVVAACDFHGNWLEWRGL